MYGNLVSAAASDTDAQLQAKLAPDASKDRVTVNKYDSLNRLNWTSDALGRVTSHTYDAFGNVTSTASYVATVVAGTPPDQVNAGAGSLVERYVYDAQNRVIFSSNAAGAVTGTTYDAAGNVYTSTQYANLAPGVMPNTVVASASDLVQRLRHDGLGRLTYAGDATGGVTLTVYDAFGNTKQVTRFANASPNDPMAVVADPAHDIVTSATYDIVGRRTSSTDGAQHTTLFVYDGFGELVYQVAPDGAVTQTDYDVDRRPIRTTNYATQIVTSSLGTAPTSAQVAQLVHGAQGKDAVTANQYDNFGRVTFSMDGNGAVTQFAYDAAGRVTDVLTRANTIALSAWSTTAPPTVTPDAQHDRHTHTSYTAFGDVLARMDGLGAVTIYAYDIAGQRTDATSYANEITPSSWTGGGTPSVTANAPHDIHQRYAYDTFGRLTFTADGTNAVVAYVYDAAGNITSKTSLFTPAGAAQALSAVATAPGADRTDRYGYDAFNRQVWHADATNALDYTAYDAAGRVTQTIRYAAFNSGALPTSTAPLATGANDRIVRNVYNALGELTASVDATNAVTASTYYLDGRLHTQMRYANTITAGADPGSVTTNAANDELTQYVYDAAGHVQQTTNGENGTQSFGYDGLGNKTSFTNEKGLTWNYAYDAQSRLVTQTTPTVDILTNDFSFGGRLASSAAYDTLVTTMVYDGVGKPALAHRRTVERPACANHQLRLRRGRQPGQRGPARGRCVRRPRQQDLERRPAHHDHAI